MRSSSSTVRSNASACCRSPSTYARTVSGGLAQGNGVFDGPDMVGESRILVSATQRSWRNHRACSAKVIVG